MNGLERVKATFRRKPVDRVPFYPIVSALTGRLIGVDARTYYTDFDKLADSYIAFFEDVRPDVLALMPDLLMEVDAMGAEVEFPVDDVPRLRSYLLREKDALGTLEFPPLKKAGRIPSYLDACRKVAASVKDSAIGAVISGPWTLATHLRGAENLIMDTVTDPGFVHEIMRFTSGIVKELGEAVKKAGVGLSLSEAPASLSLISPKIFREFVMPYEKEVISWLHDRKVSVTVHICGFIDPIMEDIVSMCAIAISIDKPSSLDKMLQVSRGRAVVIGNVSTGVFVDGTGEDIEAEVRRCLAAGKGKEGYILSTGCEISPKGEIEKIRTFCELVSKLGSYG
jgi:uroporphyrinogen decarboxylase